MTQEFIISEVIVCAVSIEIIFTNLVNQSVSSLSLIMH
jgi:hypothetical protein